MNFDPTIGKADGGSRSPTEPTPRQRCKGDQCACRRRLRADGEARSTKPVALTF